MASQKENQPLTPAPLNVPGHHPLSAREPPPMHPLSPGNKPELARQREHSTCVQPTGGLSRPKTRTLNRTLATSRASSPSRACPSIVAPLFSSRKADMILAVERRPSRRYEVRRDSVEMDLSPTLPHVALRVFADHASLASERSGDIWVAIEAQFRSSLAPAATPDPDYSWTTISHLRICYKLLAGSTLLEQLGNTTAKDVRVGQTCQLFLHIRIRELVWSCTSASSSSSSSSPPAATLAAAAAGLSADECFRDLESALGVYATDFLQVEVKYRHPLIPPDSITSVKDTCKMSRPTAGNIWSMSGDAERLNRILAVELHANLARFRAKQLESAAAAQSCEAQTTSLLLLAPSQQPTVVVSGVQAHAGCAPADSARTVWHHIRRSSLPSTQLLEGVEQLEASDETLRARRQEALSNKRSVGADTLRGWKWEEKAKELRRGGESEAPWL